MPLSARGFLDISCSTNYNFAALKRDKDAEFQWRIVSSGDVGSTSDGDCRTCPQGIQSTCRHDAVSVPEWNRSRTMPLSWPDSSSRALRTQRLAAAADCQAIPSCRYHSSKPQRGPSRSALCHSYCDPHRSILISGSQGREEQEGWLDLLQWGPSVRLHCAPRRQICPR